MKLKCTRKFDNKCIYVPVYISFYFTSLMSLSKLFNQCVRVFLNLIYFIDHKLNSFEGENEDDTN